MRKMLIVVEGPDGSGKTILSKLLAKKLSAYWTFEPFGLHLDLPTTENSKICNSLRELCLNKTNAPYLSETSRELLMLANRSIHTNYLKDLKTKKIVSDRSWISGLVYNSVNTPTFNEDIWFDILIKQVKPIPIDILINVTSNKKILKTGNNDIYDSAGKEFHCKIEQKFKELDKSINLKQAKLFNPNLSLIGFENNFNLTPEENVGALMQLIQNTQLGKIN